MMALLFNYVGIKLEKGSMYKDAVKELKADAILRGLRAFSDFEYELQMALLNRNLKPSCETIFMMPTLKNSFVSSSLVKEIARYSGDYTAYVPGPVAEAIRRKQAGGKK